MINWPQRARNRLWNFYCFCATFCIISTLFVMLKGSVSGTILCMPGAIFFVVIFYPLKKWLRPSSDYHEV